MAPSNPPERQRFQGRQAVGAASHFRLSRHCRCQRQSWTHRPAVAAAACPGSLENRAAATGLWNGLHRCALPSHETDAPSPARLGLWHAPQGVADSCGRPDLGGLAQDEQLWCGLHAPALWSKKSRCTARLPQRRRRRQRTAVRSTLKRRSLPPDISLTPQLPLQPARSWLPWPMSPPAS